MISSDAIIGVIGTLIGTVLGWELSRVGKVIVDISDVDINFFKFNPPQDYMNLIGEENPDGIVAKFSIAVINRKGIPCSFLEKEVILEYQDEKVAIDCDIFNFQNSDDELEPLLNVDAYSTVKVNYNKSYTILPHPEKLKKGYKLYLQYRLNGRKRYTKLINMVRM